MGLEAQEALCHSGSDSVLKELRSKDSITLPPEVYWAFKRKGYDCQGFWMDLPGLSLSAKALEAKRRVQKRMESGGHFARAYEEQIQKSRSSAEQLRAQGLEMAAFLGIEGEFRQEPWSCWKTFQPSNRDDLKEKEAEKLLKCLVGEKNKGFTVKKHAETGLVKTVAVKQPIDATLTELNLAVKHFSKLEELILDESNISGLSLRVSLSHFLDLCL